MNKLFKACIALAAFAAFAVVPSIASASNDPALYEPTSTLLTPSHAAPIEITAQNTEPTTLKNAAGETLISCEHAHMEGNLETNAPTPTSEAKVEGTITAATFTSPKHGAGTECTSPTLGTILVTPSVAGSGGELPWCLSATAAMKTDEFQVRGGGCTSPARQITFQLHITSLALTCNYHRTAAEPIPGTYTTHPTNALLSISSVRFTKESNSSGFCPSEGFLNMKFTLVRKSNQAHIYIKNHDGK